MKSIVALLLFGFAADALAQPTAKNDDSCDISLLPAATLLLPYFEVDIASPAQSAKTTYVTIVNTTQIPQIGHVTIWSDWAYPVLVFDVFLTGYDVQAINLYDVIARGLIAPRLGGSNASTPGSRSLSNLSGNPKFLPAASVNCAPLSQPAEIPASVLADLQTGLTTGFDSLCGRTRIGGAHPNAIGYVTIDVVATCFYTMPTETVYYRDEILFDNVLTGDFQILDPASTAAEGGPLVHIRAVPEGGPAGSRTDSSLPYTFYDRYTPSSMRNIDRRQPLPSVFAARHVQNSSIATTFTIWREGITAPTAACSAYVDSSRQNFTDAVRFDERENPTTLTPIFWTLYVPDYLPLPTASKIASSHSFFPPLTSGDPGGWMYLNLDNRRAFGEAPSPYSSNRPSQNWVRIAMRTADGRYDTDFDATSLGNGCSEAAPFRTDRANPVGPRP